MSRKGKQPIALPKGVEATINGQAVTVKGPKGTLSLNVVDGIDVKKEADGFLHVTIRNEEQQGMSKFHGLVRSLVANMVQGVNEGFQKSLDMIGVGYRASVQGNNLQLLIGTSHDVFLEIPKGLQVKVEKNTQIQISGADKREVGEFAAKVRAKKKPEPYQGKGIRYTGEYVRKKAGKAAAKSK